MPRKYEERAKVPRRSSHPVTNKKRSNVATCRSQETMILDPAITTALLSLLFLICSQRAEPKVSRPLSSAHAQRYSPASFGQSILL